MSIPVNDPMAKFTNDLWEKYGDNLNNIEKKCPGTPRVIIATTFQMVFKYACSMRDQLCCAELSQEQLEGLEKSFINILRVPKYVLYNTMPEAQLRGLLRAILTECNAISNWNEPLNLS